MKRLLFFWLILITITHAFSNDAEILKRANGSLKSGNSARVLNAHNDYKNLYLRAVINNDSSLLIESLEGVIASGEKLRKDTSFYVSELNLATKSSNSKRQKVAKPAPKIYPIKVKKSSKQVKKIEPIIHQYKSHKWYSNGLALSFNYPIKREQIKYLKLYDKKNRSYRYIYDIVAGFSNRTMHLKYGGIESIKIGQFNSKTLRLVVKSKTRLKLDYELKNREFVLYFPKNKSTKLGKKIEVLPRKKVAITAPMYRVVIDPGHGGKDAGAVGYRKWREKVVTLKISEYVRDYLKKRGFKVYMTRANDRFIKLRNRTKYANRKKADIFISIHANSIASRADKLHGIETFFLAPAKSKRAMRVASKENIKDVETLNYFGKSSFLNFLNREKIIASNKLAIDIQQGMLSSLRARYSKVRDSGVREAPFWVLVGAQMPSVLIEVGYISHPTEARRLVNKNYQMRLASGIADGIERYFVKNH